MTANYYFCFIMGVQILEILKYTLPAIVVLVAAYLIVNKFLVKEIERKQLVLFGENSQEIIKLRMQAYERLAIFMERIHPVSMIRRYYTQGISAQDLQIGLVQNIRAEYEHNVSQQIYVSNEVWQTVKNVMEQEISMFNQIGASLPMGVPAQDFITKVTEYVIHDDTALPTDVALQIINGEAKKILIH